MIPQNYLLFVSRLITAFPVGFAAGYLLVQRAEQLICQKVIAQGRFRPESIKWKAVLLMMLGTMLLLSLQSLDGLFLRNWLFFCLLFLSAYVDYFIYLIPNEGILLALLLWGLWEICTAKPFGQILLQLAVAMLFAGGILLVVLLMEKWKKRRMLGRGDIKLLFVCVLFLGAEKALYVLALACICGLLSIATKKGKPKIPFGPCIVFAGFLMML